MKKLVCLFFLMILIFCGCNSKEDDLAQITKRGKIIVGVRTDAAPFGFKDINGTIQGYDIELAKILAKSILGSENAVTFVPVTAANRVEKLNSKEVDMLIATMSITNQRLLVVDFSDPYYVAGQALMVKSISHVNSLRHLKDKRVIIVFGSTGEESIKQNVPQATILGFKTYNEAIEALKRGQGDALIADDTVLLSFELANPSLKLLKQRYSREPYAIAFRHGKDSERLKKRVNFTIANLKTMGVLRQLEEKWGIKNNIQ